MVIMVIISALPEITTYYKTAAIKLQGIDTVI